MNKIDPGKTFESTHLILIEKTLVALQILKAQTGTKAVTFARSSSTLDKSWKISNYT